MAEIEFIAKKLYPAHRIFQMVAEIYAYVIEFCIRAQIWYDKTTKNVLQKIWRPIYKPWKLEFEDLCTSIEQCVRNLRDQTLLAHQVELREMHSKVTALLALRANSHHFLQRAFGEDATTLRVNPSLKTRLTRVSVASYLSGNPFDSKAVMVEGLAMQDRRRARCLLQEHRVWTTKEVQDWLSTPKSSTMFLEGSGTAVRDMALDLIRTVTSEGLSVIWYLASSSPDITTRVSVTDMLRSWIDQLITQHPDNFASTHLNERDFQSCDSLADWLSLFVAVLSHVPAIALVIDGRGRSPEIAEILLNFRRTAERLKCTTIIKIMVLADRDSRSTETGLFAEFQSFTRVSASSSRATRPSSRELQRTSRARGILPADRGGTSVGVDNLKTLARQLVSSVGRTGAKAEAQSQEEA